MFGTKHDSIVKDNDRESLLGKAVLFIPVLCGSLICAFGIDILVEAPVLKDLGHLFIVFGVWFSVKFFLDEIENRKMVRQFENDLKEFDNLVLEASKDPERAKEALAILRKFNV